MHKIDISGLRVLVMIPHTSKYVFVLNKGLLGDLTPSAPQLVAPILAPN